MFFTQQYFNNINYINKFVMREDIMGKYRFFRIYLLVYVFLCIM